MEDRIEKLKQEAIDNPPKKKKGCTSCKKKKNEVTELPQLDLITEPTIIFDKEDIIKAYWASVEKDGIREEMKPFISDVYRQIFNEEFEFGNCASCKNNQYNKLRNYVRFHLKHRI